MKRTLTLVLAFLLMLGLTACGDDEAATSSEESKEAGVLWEYITELPDSFPKLCNSVTTAQENYSEEKSACAIYWAVLDESTFNGYLEAIEKWAGASFGDKSADGTVTLSAKINGESITISAAHNGSASGNFLEGGNYDSQARIEVITERGE